MPPDTSAQAELLACVRTRIEDACRRVGRAPDTVTLVAVSKTFPAERVRALFECGHMTFGENRVQEALRKIEEVGPGPRWHLVGHLQRNKARHAAGVFELIHSLDRPELARELDRRAAARATRQAVLIQANLAREETKHGLEAGKLPALVDLVAELPHLELRGLMTIPPPADDPEKSRRWFSSLRELRDAAERQCGRPLPELSMGMTDDFEVAIEEGATLIRVGRALFGERPTVE